MKAIVIVFATAISIYLGLSIDPNEPIAVLPFKMDGSHILVEVSVNGSDKIPMTFDTGGASSLIDSKKAEEIGLEVSGSQEVTGAAGATTISYSLGNQVSIGGLEYDNSMFVMTSLEHMRKMGSKTYGVLGHQEISRYVVKIDYEAQELLFYDKERYTYDGTGSEIPIGLEMRVPSIDGEIELSNGTTVNGRFLIDTGAGLYGGMNTPAVKKYEALNSLTKSYQNEAAGATQVFNMTNGRISSLSIGEHKFTNVPFIFNEATSGAVADTRYVGLIGNRIMKRFNIILDYENKRMILEPNKFYDEAYRVNASGIITEAGENGELLVKDVINNSPASELGLKKGDILLEVNRVKAKATNRSMIREILEKNGQTIPLNWESNGKRRSDDLSLKNII